MRLGKTAVYGLFASLYVAKNASGKPVQGREIAKAHDLPVEYLLKILQSLTKGGILKSARGRAGGFVLNRPVEAITLRDIVETLESPPNLKELLQQTVSGHPELKATLCSVYDRMLDSAQESLGEVSLQHLLERDNGSPAVVTAYEA